MDTIYSAGSATILVSEDTTSEIILKASAAAIPLGSLALADPKLGLTVTSSNGKIIHIVAANNLRPLYLVPESARSAALWQADRRSRARPVRAERQRPRPS